LLDRKEHFRAYAAKTKGLAEEVCGEEYYFDSEELEKILEEAKK